MSFVCGKMDGNEGVWTMLLPAARVYHLRKNCGILNQRAHFLHIYVISSDFAAPFPLARTHFAGFSSRLHSPLPPQIPAPCCCPWLPRATRNLFRAASIPLRFGARDAYLCLPLVTGGGAMDRSQSSTRGLVACGSGWFRHL